MKILIVDDERNIRESIQRLFEIEGVAAATACDGRAAVAQLSEQAFDAVVLDLRMPRMDGQQLLEWIRGEGLRTPVVMISALGEVKDAVKALKSGADDYLIKPFDPAELIRRVRFVVTARKRDNLVEAGARTVAGASRLIGDSASTCALRRSIDKIAAGDSTVLITGESGSGKEVVAREIHSRSAAAAEPFVAINIGGIHEHLIESELFGHEKGAFTGAETRKSGLFELAGSGTIFLDEVGEMPLPLQVKLLRVIQERKSRRLGGTRDIPIEARILSATNRDIETLVREGRFREDLYYRINVVRIAVPPLRARLEDVPLLAGFLLSRLSARMGRPRSRIAPDALEALSAYPYPGNVRELENILERALIYCEDDEIRAADLALGRPSSRAVLADPYHAGAGSTSLDDVEREAIARVLAGNGGNRTRAARELGISRRTILNKIKRYGIG
jgi:two-component system, NtrC family, response regulator AtoC